MVKFVSANRLLIMAALVFAFWAFSVFIREYVSFYAGAGTAPQVYIASDNAFARRPFGLQSSTREITRCFDGLARARAAALVATANQNCLDLADGILARSPSHGAAMQLRSETLLTLGDIQDARTAIQNAALAAPNSAWLVQRRLLTILRYPNQHDPQLAKIADGDVARLMRLNETRAWLAGVYKNIPNLRPIIGRNQAQFSAGDAANFLAKVTAVAQ